MIPTSDDSDSGASLNETNQTTCLCWGGGGGGLLSSVNRTEIVLIRNSSAINFIINKA